MVVCEEFVTVVPPSAVCTFAMVAVSAPKEARRERMDVIWVVVRPEAGVGVDVDDIVCDVAGEGVGVREDEVIIGAEKDEDIAPQGMENFRVAELVVLPTLSVAVTCQVCS